MTAHRWYPELEAWGASVAADDTSSATLLDVDYERLDPDTETIHLSVLGFTQQGAYCCGVNSVEDYTRRRAPPPSSCRCRVLEEGKTQPACSEELYPLVTGALERVWQQGCQAVVAQFLYDLTTLQEVLVMTAILQLMVMLLTMLLAHNMPDAKDDEDDDDDDDSDDSDDDDGCC